MKIILLKISVGLVLFFTVIYMCINTAALEDASPETLCDYTDFHMEYYYTTPPENGEYFYIGQEGRSEPDEVIQVTIRFVNDGKYPIDIDNMVITENDIVFCTAEDLGKTLPGKSGCRFCGHILQRANGEDIDYDEKEGFYIDDPNNLSDGSSFFM